VVVDGGVIREMGTHEELRARGGYYAGLVERQRLGFLTETEAHQAA
jgi:ABC-type multidrug transport system fused ATPase/permease subunit